MVAAEVTNSGLEKLHEIVLPEPVSWTPQTMGWYAVFGLALLAASWWLWGRVRRYRGNRYRRLALAEMEVIQQELQQPQKRPKALAKIPLVLKWTALSAFPRSEVAELSGENWLGFLDTTMGGENSREGEGQLLSELAYAPVPQIIQLRDEQIGKLLRLVRRWIKRHHATP